MSRSSPTTRVLVVEDDPDIAMLLARSLARAGFAVDQISSGADVLPTLRRGQPDLLLLDLMGPGNPRKAVIFSCSCSFCSFGSLPRYGIGLVYWPFRKGML